MSIELPQFRLPQTATPRFLDWGADMTPPMGGGSQRLNRIGDRFALVISYPRLKPEPDGRILMSRVRQAKQLGALFPVPEPGLPVVDYGNPAVNGATQQGSTLQLRGLAPNALVVEGKWLSIIFNGQRYLHHTAGADARADGSGAVDLSIFPMLRISPNDGAIVELAKPYIEGSLGGNTVDVELAIAKSTPATITITERD